MKIFNYDDKHQSVKGSIEVSSKPEVLEEVRKIVSWLNENVLTTRYSKLEIAEDFDLQWPDGEQELTFIGG